MQTSCNFTMHVMHSVWGIIHWGHLWRKFLTNSTVNGSAMRCVEFRVDGESYSMCSKCHLAGRFHMLWINPDRSRCRGGDVECNLHA